MGPVVVSSPTKSTHSKSSVNNERSISKPNRPAINDRNNLMTDNVIYSNSSNSRGNGHKLNESTRRKSRDNQINGEINSETQTQSSSPIEEKECNRFGFFVDSNKTQLLPELNKNELNLIRKRERKWISMLENWDKFINNRWKRVRDRCRKGIPHSIRGQAWLYLCGAHHQIRLHPNAFKELSSQAGSEQIVDEIRKDLHRQFPNHELFAKRNGTGQLDLFYVLKAFSILKPDIGYCQGQAPIAAVLLMHMPAEQAFWSLVAICDHYLPGYFSPGLEAIQLHGDMLFAFLKRFSPNAHKLMEKQKIEPILFMTEWFMCIFARTLPWTSVLRVWDMFLCEGIKIVFKIAIILVSETLKHENKKTCPSMYETLEKLRNIPEHHMSEPILVEHVLQLELHDRDLQREHNIQEKRRRKAKNSPNNKRK